VATGWLVGVPAPFMLDLGSAMAQSFGAPYHPGAERYYREAGLLRKSGG